MDTNNNYQQPEQYAQYAQPKSNYVRIQPTNWNTGFQHQRQNRINYAEVEGFIEPNSRNANPNAPIPFYSKDGGQSGISSFNLRVSEPMNVMDEQGRPKVRTTYISITVRTNQKLPPQFVANLFPGMYVHCYGHLRNNSFEDRQGQKRTKMVIDAYFVETKQPPMQQFVPQGQPYQAPVPTQPLQSYGNGYAQPQPTPPINADARRQPEPQERQRPAQPTSQAGSQAPITIANEDNADDLPF